MVSEVRFRDILCNDANLRILSNKIGQIIGKDDLRLTLIAKELPLPFDDVGLQLKFCDIVGFDADNNVYIIELKKAITQNKINSVEKQVTEYVETLERTISFIKSDKKLHYQHNVLLRYFEYVNLDFNQIKDIIPVIISIREISSDYINELSIPAGSFDPEIENIFLRNFIQDKKRHFMETYKDFFSSKGLNIQIEYLLDQAQNKLQLDYSWFPVILNKFMTIDGKENPIMNPENDSNDISYSYNLIFENVNNFKKEKVDLTPEISSLLSNSNNSPNDILNNLPGLYYQFKPREIFDKIYENYKIAESEEHSLKFVVQLFKSGRSFPIIYLQIFENVYVPLAQVKPVIVSIGSCVNSIIVNDFQETLNEKNNCFYEDVILFDKGNYKITLEESEGVKFFKITLYGEKGSYEFMAYSPKFRAVNELLPYMNPEKVKNSISEIIKEKGEYYLFKKDEENAEWITSKIRLYLDNKCPYNVLKFPEV